MAARRLLQQGCAYGSGALPAAGAGLRQNGSGISKMVG